MVEKGDFEAILGVIGSMIGAALSWAAGHEVITVLFSVSFGTILGYIVQNKTQKNAWKREAALKKINDIYGPIYSEINNILGQFSEKEITTLRSSFYGDPNKSWESIKSSYLYYLIDLNLREGLDKFFNLVREHNVNYSKSLNIAENIFRSHLRQTFGDDVQAASFQTLAMQDNGMPINLPSGIPSQVILMGLRPLEYVAIKYPGYTDYRLTLSLQRSGSMTVLFGPDVGNAEASRKFDDIIEATLNEVNTDPTNKLLKEQKRMVFDQANSLVQILKEKIQEPWRA